MSTEARAVAGKNHSVGKWCRCQVKFGETGLPYAHFPVINTSEK